jgi:hypothetical protein
MYVAQPSRGFGAVSGKQEVSAVGGALVNAGQYLGPAAPFVQIAGLITEFLGQMGVGSGCGQSCVLATQYANQMESLLMQNITAYFSIAAPRPLSAQRAALANFDTLWADFSQQASNPALGDAGKRAISERQAGSCAWKQTGTPPWGTPANGECLNAFSQFRDPIANDLNVYDDSVAAVASSAIQSGSSTVDAVASSLGVSTTVLIGLGVVAAIGIWAVTS